MSDQSLTTRSLGWKQHASVLRTWAVIRQRRSDRVVGDIQTAPLPVDLAPTVSVVIPVKHSQRTIRATVDCLLRQDYPALTEIIVVGDVGDPTWAALLDVSDPRL